MSDEKSDNAAKSTFDAWGLDLLEHLDQKAHERRVDQTVAYIGIDDDGFEVVERVKF